MSSFPASSDSKASVYNAGDLGSIPGLGRSPGERKGYPVQYFGLESPGDSPGHHVAKSQTQLNDFHFHYVGDVHSSAIYNRQDMEAT